MQITTEMIKASWIAAKRWKLPMAISRLRLISCGKRDWRLLQSAPIAVPRRAWWNCTLMEMDVWV